MENSSTDDHRVDVAEVEDSCEETLKKMWLYQINAELFSSYWVLYSYLPRLKNIGQIRLLPPIFPPQRKSPQTRGHLNLVRTLRAHEQKSNIIIFT